MAKFRPLHDRVLVRRADPETKKGTILIPDHAQVKPTEAFVIAVGDGKMLSDGTVQPVGVKTGDRVLFGKYSGAEIKIEDVEHIILSEDEILGVFVSE